ncbi:MAG: hypothetical protein K1X47_05355 [Cyclobacteriaceae bacterium]|nr:hypothetical protein [Cyclobacteriaceae bacterium]
MKILTFEAVNIAALAVTLSAATFSLMGIAVTGVYPGILVLWCLTFIPIISRIYKRRQSSHSATNEVPRFRLLTVVNALCILVVLWMGFVIVHDRVLGDCC